MATKKLHFWYIPDAFIPEVSTPPETSHESICVLNDAAEDAEIRITAFFADQEPTHSDPIVVPQNRDLHLRTDRPEMLGGLDIPRGVPYGIRVESNVPVQLQYSRLDTTQAAYSLMTALPASPMA